MKSADYVGEEGARRALLSAHPAGDGRAVVLFATDGECIHADGHRWTLGMSETACDLSLLRSGTAPVLVEHQRHLDDVVGVVEAAWIAGARGKAIIRFGQRRRARDIRLDVEAGILRNCSIGFRILASEERDGSLPGRRRLLATAWVPYEVSIVAVGIDPLARVVSSGEPAAVTAALIENGRVVAELARIERLAKLSPDAWRTMAPAAAADLVARFGIPEADAAAIVLKHVERTLEGLAAG